MPHDSIAPAEHHATLSPSAFPALAACPQYKSDPQGSEAAERGKRLHELVAASYLRQAVAIPVEDVEEVNWATVTIVNLLGPDAEVEQRVDLLDEDFSSLTFGTVDYYQRGFFSQQDAPNGALLDLKTGERRDYRRQMAVYALALMDRDGLDHIRVILVYSKFRDIEAFDMNRAEAEELVRPVIASVKAGEPARACDYCKWCVKRGTCEALAETALPIAQAYIPQMVKEDYIPLATPQQIAMALSLAAQVEMWAEAIREEAKKRLEAGAEIPGWTLTERAGRRSIPDIQRAFELCGLEAADFLKACTLSPTSLEKVFTFAKGLKPTAAKKELAGLLGHLFEQGAPSKSITRAKASA